MDVDLLLGTEQALMLHSVSNCIFDVAVVINVCRRGQVGGEFTLHQIRELNGSRVGHVLAMAPSNLSKFKTLAQFWSVLVHVYMICTVVTPCACAAGGRVIGLSVSLHVCLSVDVERFEQ